MMKLFSMRSIRTSIVAMALAVAPAASFAGIFISVGFAPPALPVYVQPICPGDGYLWNPGYWAYGPEGYYWVPGVWVRPPQVGLLWTPGYWGWGGTAFVFHEGYWGPHVGFYGGINYGFGYGGVGFVGGRWNGGVFAYNTAVMHVNTTIIHNVYVEPVHVTVAANFAHTSFNGGAGGVPAHATPQEQQWSHETHIPPTALQQQHVQLAHADKANFASANGGHPTHLTAVTVNNYRNVTVNNNHNTTTNTAVNNHNTTNTANVHNTTNTANVNNHNAVNNTANVNNHTTTENSTANRTVENGNHDAAVNRPAPAARPAAKPAPKPEARPEEREGGREAPRR